MVHWYIELDPHVGCVLIEGFVAALAKSYVIQICLPGIIRTDVAATLTVNKEEIMQLTEGLSNPGVFMWKIYYKNRLCIWWMMDIPYKSDDHDFQWSITYYQPCL